MSTFAGLVEEFPGISIDQFEKENLKSSVYLLSHIHSDHVKGINSSLFLDRLIDLKLVCYSSEVTTLMLRQWFPEMAAHFQYLPLNTPKVLLATDYYFTVTLLPAGHCPGSVMFLLERDGKTVLYTGDFRLNVNEFKKFKAIYAHSKTPKHFDKVYIDSTFMFQHYFHLPSREESLDALCALIADWIEKSQKHVVNIEIPYRYGGEYVITEVYKRFKIPIHVSGVTFENYRYFPNMDKCITLAAGGNIHYNCMNFGEFCSIDTEKDAAAGVKYRKTFKLSAMRWLNQNKNESIVCEGYGVTYVCYSSHSCLSEILGILEFLQPAAIEPNVVPSKTDDFEKLQKVIKTFLESRNSLRNLGINGPIDCVQNESSDDEPPSKVSKLQEQQVVKDKENNKDVSDLDMSIFD